MGFMHMMVRSSCLNEGILRFVGVCFLGPGRFFLISLATVGQAPTAKFTRGFGFLGISLAAESHWDRCTIGALRK